MSEAATIIERLTRSARIAQAARLPMAAAGVLAAVALSGCASQPPPKPTAQLVRASTLITVAENDEAQRYAAADLQRARDELSDAKAADADHQYERARALAHGEQQGAGVLAADSSQPGHAEAAAAAAAAAAAEPDTFGQQRPGDQRPRPGPSLGAHSETAH